MPRPTITPGPSDFEHHTPQDIRALALEALETLRRRHDDKDALHTLHHAARAAHCPDDVRLAILDAGHPGAASAIAALDQSRVGEEVFARLIRHGEGRYRLAINPTLPPRRSPALARALSENEHLWAISALAGNPGANAEALWLVWRYLRALHVMSEAAPPEAYDLNPRPLNDLANTIYWFTENAAKNPALPYDLAMEMATHRQNQNYYARVLKSCAVNAEQFEQAMGAAKEMAEGGNKDPLAHLAANPACGPERLVEIVHLLRRHPKALLKALEHAHATLPREVAMQLAASKSSKLRIAALAHLPPEERVALGMLDEDPEVRKAALDPSRWRERRTAPGPLAPADTTPR